MVEMCKDNIAVPGVSLSDRQTQSHREICKSNWGLKKNEMLDRIRGGVRSIELVDTESWTSVGGVNENQLQILFANQPPYLGQPSNKGDPKALSCSRLKKTFPI